MLVCRHDGMGWLSGASFQDNKYVNAACCAVWAISCCRRICLLTWLLVSLFVSRCLCIASVCPCHRFVRCLL